MILPVTSLPLSSRHRVLQISFHPSQPYLAVQSHDRSVEIFRIRTEEEAKKKQARRRKRAKEKKEKGKGTSASAQDEAMELDEEGVSLLDLFTPHLVVRASGKVRSFDFSQGEAAKGNLSVCIW
jgi:U3 small nucleolar RNA-associated protein 12